MMYKPLERLYL